MRHIALAAASAAALVAMPATGQDAFPVTLDHFYGETVIDAEAERIVTLSWMAQDTVLALGEVPIAIQSQTWGGDENGYLPWVKEAVEDLGADLPLALDTANGLPFEQILELEPDLILAPYSGLSQDDYDRLSAIAPTVAFKEAPWTGSWQYVVETVGAAMGRSEEAAGLVASTQDGIARYAADNPQFAGRTFAFGGGSDAGNVGFYIPSDPRVHLMEDLGLVPAEALNDLPTDNYVQQVSFEQLDTVDAEIFIAWYSSQDDLDTLMANPLFARWKPIANDRFVPLIDRAFVMALSAPSPLSIPWMMDRFVPMLAETLEQ
ncbi:iron-siderophore ABC transporter substrate-binding protein [Pelagibacterium nitratireducens]|uniref:Iron-siderophore ABC transporter substrate-binding protein n=1 Tax=Pelagibacterium nitratireducens TaxID=1046114 RepID=A0ABZ2HX69_9HYPH|tara:strand:- start:257 stop:1216 length:960 start_codon:yes stop_codon:yes gene_type:complete